ncbi:MAG: chalcone isomerase family protein [Desulfobacterium sp.]|nr:chalcone isomerase family protein [Desulfobacterium sp.]
MKRIIIIVLCLMLNASQVIGFELGETSIPDTLAAGENALVLNGAGYRTKFFIKAYVGGLYLMEKSHDPELIISSNSPMAIRLHIVSSLITSQKMVDAVTEGFMKATKEDTASIQNEIDRMLVLFREEIKVGDIYDLIYIPGTGVTASKNRIKMGTFSGLEFKRALFGIWLCDSPADATLKQKMLGN